MSKYNGSSEVVTLTHVDSPEIQFPTDRRWVSVYRFRATLARTELELLTALVTDDWYGDSYAAPTPTSPAPGGQIHGPYRRDAISSQSFVQSSRDKARERLEAWARMYDWVPEDFFSQFTAFIKENLPHDYAIFELPDIRSTAQHDWGGVVGQDGFYEFVAISPDLSALNLFVASDD